MLTDVSVTFEIVNSSKKEGTLNVALPLKPFTNVSAGGTSGISRAETNTIVVNFKSPYTVSNQTVLGDREKAFKPTESFFRDSVAISPGAAALKPKSPIEKVAEDLWKYGPPREASLISPNKIDRQWLDKLQQEQSGPK